MTDHYAEIDPDTGENPPTREQELQARIRVLRAEVERLREQIDKLAEFIMYEVPGEPSQSEGAVDCAIRLLRAALNDAG